MNVGTYTLAEDFVSDKKLLDLLSDIEVALGYKIEAIQIMEQHKSQAVMSCIFGEDKKWRLAIDKKEPANQDALCHEFMHFVLWLEGWPVFYVNNLVRDEFLCAALDRLKNLILHIDLWGLVRSYGFNDECAYNFDQLIEGVMRYTPNPKSDSRLVLAMNSIDLAQGLLQPGPEDKKIALRNAAFQKDRLALGNADVIISLFQNLLPLNPARCVFAAQKALGIVGLPDDLLLPEYTDRIFPNFREQIFAGIDRNMQVMQDR